MFAVIFIVVLISFESDCREQVLHKFQSINSTIPELGPVFSNVPTFYDCKLIHQHIFWAKCEGFSCWESQLRDTTRVKILKVLNEFRSRVFDNHYCGRFKNTHHRSIILVEWHWKLESETQSFLEDCPVHSQEKNIVMNLDVHSTQLRLYNSQNIIPFDCDMVATSFPVQSGSQGELISLLPLILEKNWLDDFDKTDEYKRLNSLFVGCSYILRNNVTTVTASGAFVIRGSVGHFSCMFCSPPAVKVMKDCPSFTRETSKNDKLCKLISNSTEMPCELNSIRCPLMDKSMTWMFTAKTLVGVVYENETYKIFMKTMELNPVEFDSNNPNHPKFPSVSSIFLTPYVTHIDLYDRKFCIVLCLVFIFVLSLLFLLLVLIYKNKIIFRS